VVVGTSLFQILVTMTGATVLHARHQPVGRHHPGRAAAGRRRHRRAVRRPGGAQPQRLESFRLLLALLILAVGLRFAVELVLPPSEPYLGGACRKERSDETAAGRARLGLVGDGSGPSRRVPAKAEALIAALSSTPDRRSASNYHRRPGRRCSGWSSATAARSGRADPYDIVVTVRGPRRMLLVREKERVGPIWLNRNAAALSGSARSILSVFERIGLSRSS
jgi:hypothetical protein